MARILEVQQIKYSYLKSMPPKLMIEANGIVSSIGWSDITLVVLEKKLSDDGILDLEFVGKPPKDTSGQRITPVMASILIEDDVDKILGILVHARTNNLLQMVGDIKTDQSADSDMQKTFDFTSFEIGEEGKFPPWTSFGIGEEDKFPPWTTYRIGEEGKSPYFGEETQVWGGESGPLGLETDPGIEDGRTYFGENTVVGEDFQDVFSDRIRSPFNRR